MLILKALLWILLFLSALVLIIVILLQEPKGGGLAEAFGGMGAETFGVKAGGINRFTFTVFGVFLASAILIHVLRHSGGTVPKPDAVISPANPGGGGTPAGGGGGVPAGGGGGTGGSGEKKGG